MKRPQPDGPHGRRKVPPGGQEEDRQVDPTAGEPAPDILLGIPGKVPVQEDAPRPPRVAGGEKLVYRGVKLYPKV